MTFTDFFHAQAFMLWIVFGIALIMGAVVNKTNFCTMGAVSDLVNIGDSGRFRAWLLAIAVAILGVTALETLGMVNLSVTYPSYRAGQLLWAEHLLGGFLFGIGMTLASGCGNKCLVRIGGGNLKSIMVMIVIGMIAYFMLNPFPGSDKTLFSLLFYDWTRPLSVNLGASQDLGYLIGGESVDTARMIAGGAIGVLLLWFIFKSADFRSSRDNILGGAVVGMAILAAWYVTSNVSINADDEIFSLGDYYEEWDMLAESDEGKPVQGRPLSPQSYTFINPMGQTVGFVVKGFDFTLLTFGIMAFLGVLAGSLLWSLLSHSFRFEWFSSFRYFVNHLVGAVLMGFGGTLALGCTIGQGITGLSTLAVGSFITFVAIVFGSALTMKMQYYRMVYEEEASVPSALVASLADFHLLPNSLRKLDAV
jgi:uncharacterized membrane protein YedE/YeeE